MSCRVICDLRKYDHVSSVMADLYWLKENEHIISYCSKVFSQPGNKEPW